MLYPSPQPLTVDLDELTAYFESKPVEKPLETFPRFIDSFPEDSDTSPHLRSITCSQVLQEIKILRSDCCSWPDDIPVLNLSKCLQIILRRHQLTSEAYNPEAYNFVAMLGFFREPIKIYFLIWNY